MTSPELVLNVTGLPGVGKSSLLREVAEPLGFTVISTGGIIRAYANQHGITLRSRNDYRAAQARMLAEDPDAIIRPIVHTPGLVALDGLRVYAHAQAIQAVIGPERYRTCTLVCPDTVAFERTTQDQSRRQRDASQTPTLGAFRADALSDLNDPEVQMDRVLAMHDVTPTPIDTSGPFANVAATFGVAVRGLLAEHRATLL